MPSIIKIKVLQARDLPIMDRNQHVDASTDAFVDVKIDQHQKRTATIRKSLNPVWNEEFSFTIIDDSVLQNAPLELQVLDQDLYSSELIGAAHIDLNPLIMRTAHSDSKQNLVLQGWFPLFDSVRGMKGTINISLKLQFIGNDNPFLDSSAGVQFFTASSLASNSFIIQDIIGFVEDLVVEDDPESSWKDYFRKGNKSMSDTRLKALYSVSAQVRAEIGRKVLEAGGNAVLGYTSHVDVEGNCALVARAYGTACRLYAIDDIPVAPSMDSSDRGQGQNITSLLSSCGLLANPRFRPPVSSAPSTCTEVLIESSILSSIAHEANLALLQSSNDSNGVVSQRKASPLIQQTLSNLSYGPSLHSLVASNHSDYSHYLNSGSSGGGLCLLSISKDGCVLGVNAIKSFGLAPLIPSANIGVKSNPSATGNIRLEHKAQHRNSIVDGDDASVNGSNSEHGSVHEVGKGPYINLTNELEDNEVKLFSLKSFPHHVHVRLGGLVMSRSVKFLGKLEASEADQETRVGWWEELRDEIKNHARTLCCSHIVGYSESCVIFGDVCILTAVGTAATVKYSNYPVLNSTVLAQSFLCTNVSNHGKARNPRRSKERQLSAGSSHASSQKNSPRRMSISSSQSDPKEKRRKPKFKNYPLAVWTKWRKKVFPRACACMHVPYNHSSAPFNFMRLVPCSGCGRKWVPECMLSTTEAPVDLRIRGAGQLLEVRVCRTRNNSVGGNNTAGGEADAIKISELLPFIEFDVQRQVMLKLKVMGLNAVFGFSCRLQVGATLVIATASCTAVYADSLPSPPVLQIPRSVSDVGLNSLKQSLDLLYQQNKQFLREYAAKNGTISGEWNDFILSFCRRQQRYLIKKNKSRGYDPDIICSKLPTMTEEDEESYDSSSSSDNGESSGSSSSSSSSSDTDGSSTTDGGSVSDSSKSSKSSRSSSDCSSNAEDDDEQENSLEGPSSESSCSSEDESSSSDGSNRSVKSTNRRKKKNHKKEKVDSAAEKQVKQSARRSPRPTTMLSMDGLSASQKKQAKSSKNGNGQLITAPAVRFKPKKKLIFKDDRLPFLLEIDDETDLDIHAILSDWSCPTGFEFVNLQSVPGSYEVPTGEGKMITLLTRSSSIRSFSRGAALTELFKNAYSRLCFEMRTQQPCQVTNVSHTINILEVEDVVEVMISAMVWRKAHPVAVSSVNIHPGVLNRSRQNSIDAKTLKTSPLLVANGDDSDDDDVVADSDDDDDEEVVTPQKALAEQSRNRNINVEIEDEEDKKRNHWLRGNGTPSSVETAGGNWFDSLVGKKAVQNKMAGKQTCEKQYLRSDFYLHLKQSMIANNSSQLAKQQLGVAPTSPLGSININQFRNKSFRSVSTGSVDTTAQLSATGTGPILLSRAASAGSDSIGPQPSVQPPASNHLSMVNQQVQLFRIQTISDMTASSASQVKLTAQSFIPGARISRYLGPIQLHFVKDSNWAANSDLDTLGSFFYLFIAEANSVAKAHVAALGGNALLCHKLLPQESGGRIYRNQVYNMLSLTGDAVYVEDLCASPQDRSIPRST